MPDFNRFITGQQIVERALKVIGLTVPTSISGATDATSVQIWALLTELGQELLDEFQWEFRTKTYTFATASPTLVYDLPTDFQRFIDATGWNGTARIPLIGPMTAQEWALLQARQLGGTTLRLQFIIRNNQIEFYFVPDDANTININYIGRGWVQDAAVPTTFKDTLVNDADVVLYDPRLIVSMLRFRWRRLKGFDTTDLEQEYNNALINAKNNDTPGRDLQLSRANRYPYIGNFNLPDTGIGQ